MRPYIARLGVDPEHRGEAQVERQQLWSVKVEKVLVVPEEVWQCVLRDHIPARLGDRWVNGVAVLYISR